MYQDQLSLSKKYVNPKKLGYDAAPPLPIIFEKTAQHIKEHNLSKYKFKYVPEEEFGNIVKLVKRNRKEAQEEEEWLKFIMKRKKQTMYVDENESESLLLPSTGKLEQNSLQQQSNEMFKEPKYDDLQDATQKLHNIKLKEAPSDTDKNTKSSILLEISGVRRKNKHKIMDGSSSFDITPVVGKTTGDCEQMPSNKLNQYAGNDNFLETIEEEPRSPPNSEYSMLNDIESIYQQVPFNKNKNFIEDKSQLIQEYNDLKNIWHPPPIVPRLNLTGENKESIHSQRIRNLHKKIDMALDNILELFDKIPEPDGSQDLTRRYKRAAEFSARFSRNYLYHLRRQICELKKQIRESSSLSRARHTLHQTMCQKLVAAHQSALQGLQAYLHHMPSSVQGAVSNKLKELLRHICDLCVLCNKLGVATSGSASDQRPDHIERKSKALALLIKNKHLGKEVEDKVFPLHNTVVNAMTTTGRKGWESSLREPERKVHMKSARTGRSVSDGISWKVSATKLARAAYGSPKKQSLTALKSTARLTAAKVKEEQSHCLKCDSALKMPCESVSSLDMKSLSSRLLNICEEEFRNNLGSIIRKFIDKSEAKVSDENVQKSKQSSTSVEDLKEILHQIQSIASHSALPSKSDNTLQETKYITKEGPKNAQLICFPPDDTITHSSSLHNIHNKTENISKYIKTQENTNITRERDPGTAERHYTQKTRSFKRKHCVSRHKLREKRTYESNLNSYDEDNENICQRQKPLDSSLSSDNASNFSELLGKTSPIHASDMKQYEETNKYKFQKLFPTPLIVSKKDLNSATDYKQKFEKYIKSNPMYEDTKQPWAMVGRLSDYLAEEIVQDIVNETKLDLLIHNIYNLEFGGNCMK